MPMPCRPAPRGALKPVSPVSRAEARAAHVESALWLAANDQLCPALTLLRAALRETSVFERLCDALLAWSALPAMDPALFRARYLPPGLRQFAARMLYDAARAIAGHHEGGDLRPIYVPLGRALGAIGAAELARFAADAAARLPRERPPASTTVSEPSDLSPSARTRAEAAWRRATAKPTG